MGQQKEGLFPNYRRAEKPIKFIGVGEGIEIYGNLIQRNLLKLCLINKKQERKMNL